MSEGIGFGAFLDDIVEPLTALPRLSRPSVVEEALTALGLPENRWIKEAMASYFAPSVEFRVVWRFRGAHPLDGPNEERTKPYKTEAGALRLLAKLRSNDGRYTRYWDDDRGEEHAEDLVLDYARLESRKVGRWLLVDDATPVSDDTEGAG